MTSADAFTPIQPAPRADAPARKPAQADTDARQSEFAGLLDAAIDTPETNTSAAQPAPAKPAAQPQPATSPTVIASPEAAIAADVTGAEGVGAAIETNPLLASLIVPASTTAASTVAAAPAPVIAAPAEIEAAPAPSGLAAPVPNAGDAHDAIAPAAPQAAATPAPAADASTDASDSSAAVSPNATATGNVPVSDSVAPIAAPVATPVKPDAVSADTSTADATSAAPAIQSAPQSAAPIVAAPVVQTAEQIVAAPQVETAAAAIAAPALTKSAPASTPGAQRAAARTETSERDAATDGAQTAGKAGGHAAASSQTVSAAQASNEPASNGQTGNGQTGSGQAGQKAVTADALALDAVTTTQTTDALAATRSPLSDAARPGATGQAHPALRNAPEAAIQVYSRFVERFDGRAQRFEMRLDPAELGRVDIRIEVGADKRVHAVLAAHDSGALSDLMRGQKALERALADAGIDLADGGLTFELSSESGNSASNGQAGSGDANRELAHAWRGFGAVSVPVDAETAAAATPRRWGASRLNLVA